jgi:hypothetical protein
VIVRDCIVRRPVFVPIECGDDHELEWVNEPFVLNVRRESQQCIRCSHIQSERLIIQMPPIPRLNELRDIADRIWRQEFDAGQRMLRGYRS